MSDKKKTLLVLRHTPYGSGLSQVGVDTALAYGAFGQDVALLFMGEGVLQLQFGQDGRAVGSKDIGKQLASLPLYDIEQVYVDAEAAERYGIPLKGWPFNTRPLSCAQMRALMGDYDHILGL